MGISYTLFAKIENNIGINPLPTTHGKNDHYNYDQLKKKSYKIVDKVSSHEKITVSWRVILLPINRMKKLTSH